MTINAEDAKVAEGVEYFSAFSAASAPSTFMVAVFRGMLYYEVEVFSDTFAIGNKSFSIHLNPLFCLRQIVVI